MVSPWYCGLCGSSRFKGSEYQKRNCDTADLTRKTTGISNISKPTLPQAVCQKNLNMAANWNKNMRKFTRNINKHTKVMYRLESSVSGVDLNVFYGKNVSAARQPSRLCNTSWPQNLTCASFCTRYTTNILWSGKF